MTPDLQIASPFPAEHYDMLWSWVMEFPHLTLTDFGPRGADELAGEFAHAAEVGETSWEILQSGIPVGLIRFLPLSSETWIFNGICFTRSVHGTGVAAEAVGRALRFMFDQGAEKVRAQFFLENGRVARFLRKFGAVYEGHRTEDGGYPTKPKDVVLVAIYGDAFRALHGQGSDPVGVGASEAVPASA